ncbi:hypothetical protein LINGRAPRIM_LOCUS2850, partial [Linum grandiflorum]
VACYLEEFETVTRQRLRGKNAAVVDRTVHREFVTWFRDRILNTEGDEAHSNNFLVLARGPQRQCRRFSAYDVNGYRFRTVSREKLSKTQNSGVFGSYGTQSYASSADNRPIS